MFKKKSGQLKATCMLAHTAETPVSADMRRLRASKTPVRGTLRGQLVILVWARGSVFGYRFGELRPS